MASTQERLAGLQDVDFTAQSVFETPAPGASDTSLQPTSKPPPPVLDDNIDTSPMVPAKAFQSFMGKQIAPDGTDFPDSLTSGRQQKRVVQEPLTTGPPRRPTPPPIHLRFESLRKEVEELMKDLQEAGDGAGVDATEISTQVEQLRAEVESMRQEKRFLSFLDPKQEVAEAVRQQSELTSRLEEGLGKLAEVQNKKSEALQTPTTYEVYASPDVERESGMTELERRIVGLERIVGSGSDTGLESKVQDLSERSSFLNPDALDQLKRKLQSVVHQLDHAAKQRELSEPTPEKGKRIEELATVTRRWDPIAKNIPTLIARLRSLATLHTEAASVNQDVHRMAKEQEYVADLAATYGAMLEEVAQSLAQNVETVKRNTTSLRERLDALATKISRLS